MTTLQPTNPDSPTELTLANASITTSYFNRFDQELIDQYFNEEGKKAIEVYVATQGVGKTESDWCESCHKLTLHTRVAYNLEGNEKGEDL